jgi:lipoprotein-anchoring transpeptidase ErfK/SrfK
VARPTLVVIAIAALSLTFVPRSPARAVVVSAGPAAVRSAHAPKPRPRPTGHLIAYVRSDVALRIRPGGRVVERLSSRTTFGSPQALSVVRSRHDRWLAVSTPELGNGRLAWVDARAGGLRYGRTRLELDVDLSERLVTLRSGSRVLRRFVAGVGRPGSPTPTGRFSVTDKLSGPAYNAVYGCCILALSATQPNLPAGWSGGNRIAIHGGPTSGAVTAGCIHAPDADLRYLMRLVPLGTPVVIRA